MPLRGGKAISRGLAVIFTSPFAASNMIFINVFSIISSTTLPNAGNL